MERSGEFDQKEINAIIMAKSAVRRFERMGLEIRIADRQENPPAMPEEYDYLNPPILTTRAERADSFAMAAINASESTIIADQVTERVDSKTLKGSITF